MKTRRLHYAKTDRPIAQQSTSYFLPHHGNVNVNNDWYPCSFQDTFFKEHDLSLFFKKETDLFGLYFKDNGDVVYVEFTVGIF